MQFAWRVRIGGGRIKAVTNLGAAGRVSRKGAQFFRTDKLNKRVGSAAYRAVRQVAFAIRLQAIRSMERQEKRKKRYRDFYEMPVRLQQLRLAAHRRGKQDIPYPFMPSPVGQPPRATTDLMTRNGAFGIWAAALDGVTERTTRLPDRITFRVGPRVMPPDGANRGKVPELHEFGGIGVGSDGAVAFFPKRPFMKPAYDKQIRNLPKILARNIRSDQAFSQRK